MNDKMKGFIELAKADLNQAMNLMDFIPGGREAILKFARPGPIKKHRDFFLDAASSPETDPDILHTIGIRDLPNKIRFAVMDNPKTELRTIETMANQTNNNAVQDRAKMEISKRRKFNISIKEMKEIIREELKKFQYIEKK